MLLSNFWKEKKNPKLLEILTAIVVNASMFAMATAHVRLDIDGVSIQLFTWRCSKPLRKFWRWSLGKKQKVPSKMNKTKILLSFYSFKIYVLNGATTLVDNNSMIALAGPIGAAFKLTDRLEDWERTVFRFSSSRYVSHFVLRYLVCEHPQQLKLLGSFDGQSVRTCLLRELTETRPSADSYWRPCWLVVIEGILSALLPNLETSSTLHWQATLDSGVKESIFSHKIYNGSHNKLLILCCYLCICSGGVSFAASCSRKLISRFRWCRLCLCKSPQPSIISISFLLSYFFFSFYFRILNLKSYFVLFWGT